MSVNINIGDIQLDNHIYWSDKQMFDRNLQSMRWTVWGLPIIYHTKRPSWIGGRVISLESQEDAGWQLISTAQAIKEYCDDIEIGTSFIFNYYDEYYECIFFSEEGEPAVSWSPVSRNATETTHWCLLNVKLVISQLKIYEIGGTVIGG